MQDLNHLFISFIVARNTTNQNYLSSFQKAACKNLMTQTQSFVVALVIVVVSFALLAPRIAHPTVPTVLLSESVSLTDVDYTWKNNLTLNKGDQVEVTVSTLSQPVDFKVVQDGSSPVTLYDDQGQTIYDVAWTVSAYGNYIFSLIADAGKVDATVTVTRA
jgi:hypothetical protein